MLSTFPGRIFIIGNYSWILSSLDINSDKGILVLLFKNSINKDEKIIIYILYLTKYHYYLEYYSLYQNSWIIYEFSCIQVSYPQMIVNFTLKEVPLYIKIMFKIYLSN